MSRTAEAGIEPGTVAEAGARVEAIDRDPAAAVATLIRRGRVAMDAFADATQARVDEAVTALAWSLYKPEHAEALARMAVADTGIGNAPDKVVKNQRKTFGTLRDLMRVKSVGVIEELPERGLVKYAKPVGVVGAVTPSTNPAATPRQQGDDGGQGPQCDRHRPVARRARDDHPHGRADARGAHEDRCSGGPGAGCCRPRRTRRQPAP